MVESGTAADAHPQAGRWPLIGRQAELARFVRVLKDPWSQSFVVCGPSGVGRSRLLEEFMFAAMGEGFEVGWAAASAAVAEVPLGAIAHLLPPGVDPACPGTGFAAVSKALAGTDRRRRVVVVDDLHLLDASSTVLLRQLADAGLIFLVGAIRTDGPSAEAAEATEVIRWGDSAHRVDLVEFGQDTSEELLQAVLGGPVGRRTLHELFTASRGNVLYLRELVLGALHAGVLTGDGAVWELVKGSKDSLPRTPLLTELVGNRLASAGLAGRPLLELLSLCEPLGMADVAASPQILIDLEQAGLIRATDDGRRVSVTLAHPLYGEVLRERIPLMRRRALLLRQAERIEVHGAHRRDDALRIASWRLAATGTADPALLIRAAATARHTHDHARVLSLLGAVPAGHHTAGSWLLYGEALMETGRYEEAEAALAGAYGQASTEGERQAVTRMRTLNLFWTGVRAEEAVELNDEALAHVTCGTDRGLLLITKATMITMSGRPAEGVALLDEVLDEIPRGQNVNARLWGASAKVTGLALLGRTHEAQALAEVIERTYLTRLHDGHAPPPPPFACLVPLTLVASELGRLALAREIGTHGTAALLTERGRGYGQTWIALSQARVEWLAGRLATARHWYVEAANLAHAHRHIKPLRLILSGLAATAGLLGDLDVAQAALDELKAYPSAGLFAGEEYLGEAWVLAVRGHLAGAREILVHAAGVARDADQFTSEALLLTDVARLGGARQVTDRLTELALICDGDFAAARARLAAALAANDPSRLLEAAGMLEEIGADLLAAEAATAAAAAWRQNGAPRQAAAAAGQALEATARCGGAGTPILATAQATSSLTGRERDIALLAAGGAPSKDIAQTLVLSVRTVDNHLQKIYTKLGVTTRRDLARILQGKPSRRVSAPAPPARVPPAPWRQCRGNPSTRQYGLQADQAPHRPGAMPPWRGGKTM
ncbi:helix-turn-helix transcriptional regulator [Streptosporangium subroseum]|nr:LuxR family transcriptional regulator [Streptosporangium subroseum]